MPHHFDDPRSEINAFNYPGLAAWHAKEINDFILNLRTRLTAASVVPAGHVRLPDGRDVKISQAGMHVLVSIADGNPLGAYVTAGILDWNPPPASARRGE